MACGSLAGAVFAGAVGLGAATLALGPEGAALAGALDERIVDASTIREPTPQMPIAMSSIGMRDGLEVRLPAAVAVACGGFSAGGEMFTSAALDGFGSSLIEVPCVRQQLCRSPEPVITAKFRAPGTAGNYVTGVQVTVL
jgi:hypothetical protein